MEQCNTYKPWHDKATGKTFLEFDQRKYLHYYFYFFDKELGLCYLCVPIWTLFRLQFYVNEYNLLAYKLQKKGICYCMHDTFPEISDVVTTQKLSDRINPEDLRKTLDVFAKRYVLVASRLEPGYTWTVQQIECAINIMFKQPYDLEPLHDEIVWMAVFTIKPDNIATFLDSILPITVRKQSEPAITNE